MELESAATLASEADRKAVRDLLQENRRLKAELLEKRQRDHVEFKRLFCEDYDPKA